MAKLSQLLMLEGMLNTYDNMNIKDAWIVEKQGESVEELVDVIIAKLNRLLDSKTRLSCRNVLVANFETMKETKYWVKSKLFADLPKDLSKVLRGKIDQMVDLLRALIVKIIDVEADFADRFFDKLKKLYLKKRKRITDYEVWKADQSHLTIERITGFQAEITTRMLIMGILKYDDDPDEEEVDAVDLERLRKKLKKNRPLPENFDKECAKLRRYSHWEGDMFMIDYDKLRKYLFCAFGKLTCDQHIEMYEYDIQMKQIHEDIKRLKEEEMCEEEKQEMEDGRRLMADGRGLMKAINIMWAEGVLQHKYDHTWIMMTMNETEWLPSFATPTEYLDYMEGCGVRDRLPDRSTVSKYYDKARGTFPNWTFTDAKDKEKKRRNNVGKRFLKLIQRA